MPERPGPAAADRGLAAQQRAPREAPRGAPTFRLSGHARKGALTLHVLTSVGWFGVAVAVVFCWIAARTATDPALGRALYLAIGKTPWLAVPAGLTGAATGTVLGLGSRYGLISHWWVFGKILITVAVVLTDAILVGALAHAAAAGRTTPALLYCCTAGHVLLLAVATVLSVFKPRGRTPWAL